jgi:high-affinity iron transporter
MAHPRIVRPIALAGAAGVGLTSDRVYLGWPKSIVTIRRESCDPRGSGMLAPLLIMVREGFEAALIVAIVLAYLRRSGRLDMAAPVWLGVGLAALISFGVGIVVHLTVGELAGAARLRAFAAISLFAVIVLTWMVFWMRRQSMKIKGELEEQISNALTNQRAAYAVALVAFVAVLREGIEAALFMIAAATTAAGTEVFVGAVLGLAIATGLGYLVYAGGRRLPMRAFFRVTGLVLIVFAGGLLARTVLFLQSAGDLGTVDNAVYDLTQFAWLTQSSEIGKFLAAMFGWDPRPSLEQCIAWVAYVAPVTWLFLRPVKVRRPVEGTRTEPARA